MDVLAYQQQLQAAGYSECGSSTSGRSSGLGHQSGRSSVSQSGRASPGGAYLQQLDPSYRSSSGLQSGRSSVNQSGRASPGAYLLPAAQPPLHESAGRSGRSSGRSSVNPSGRNSPAAYPHNATYPLVPPQPMPQPLPPSVPTSMPPPQPHQTAPASPPHEPAAQESSTHNKDHAGPSSSSPRSEGAGALVRLQESSPMKQEKIKRKMYFAGKRGADVLLEAAHAARSSSSGEQGGGGGGAAGTSSGGGGALLPGPLDRLEALAAMARSNQTPRLEPPNEEEAAGATVTPPLSREDPAERSARHTDPLPMSGPGHLGTPSTFPPLYVIMPRGTRVDDEENAAAGGKRAPGRKREPSAAAKAWAANAAKARAANAAKGRAAKAAARAAGVKAMLKARAAARAAAEEEDEEEDVPLRKRQRNKPVEVEAELSAIMSPMLDRIQELVKAGSKGTFPIDGPGGTDPYRRKWNVKLRTSPKYKSARLGRGSPVIARRSSTGRPVARRSRGSIEGLTSIA